MTTGVRVHGLALARPAAKTANKAAVPMAISVRATPLVCWWDCPSAVEIAAKWPSARFAPIEVRPILDVGGADL